MQKENEEWIVDLKQEGEKLQTEKVNLRQELILTQHRVTTEEE